MGIGKKKKRFLPCRLY